MKSQIDLAVIIPTLNEEFYIGKLLDSIKVQSVSPKEVVVVDAKSPDGTIKEIKKRQKTFPILKYYQIPKYTIARQRNFGVKKTKSKNLLFIDADMKFDDKEALENLYEESLEKNADFAIPQIKPLSPKKLDSFLYILHNGIPKTFKEVKPLATTQCLFVKRNIFLKAGMFDEEIKVGEDFELVSRLQKLHGKFVILEKSTIYSSVRRLEKDGRLRFVALLGVSLMFVLFLGYRKNPIHKKYDFGKHPKVD
jgi:glycosyltransferase involved in cell wall biosynthesis